MIADKIIVGRSLTCLLYAWRTQTRCIVKDPEYIYRFDKRYSGYDFSFMNATNVKELWSNLSFAMSVSSLLLYPNDIQTIRMEDNLTIMTKGNRRIIFHPDEVVMFDKEENMFGVYDFFDVKHLKPHSVTRIEDNSDFVSQLDFYTFNGPTRGLLAASKMTQKEVLDPDLGQGIAKLKAVRMMEDEGLTGPFSRTYKGKRYYKKPKIEFHKRVVTPLFESNCSFGEAYNMKQKEGEAWKMIERLRTR